MPWLPISPYWDQYKTIKLACPGLDLGLGDIFKARVYVPQCRTLLLPACVSLLSFSAPCLRVTPDPEKAQSGCQSLSSFICSGLSSSSWPSSRT